MFKEITTCMIKSKVCEISNLRSSENCEILNNKKHDKISMKNNSIKPVTVPKK